MGSGQEYFANLEREERRAEEQRWVMFRAANMHLDADEVRAQFLAAERVRKQLGVWLAHKHGR